MNNTSLLRISSPFALLLAGAICACSGASSPGSSGSVTPAGASDDGDDAGPSTGADSPDAGSRDAGSHDAGRSSDSGGGDDAGGNLPNAGWAGSGTDKNASATTDRCTGPVVSTGAPIQLPLGQSGDHILGDSATLLPDRSLMVTYFVAGGVGHWSSSGTAIATSSGQISQAWPIGSTGTALGVGIDGLSRINLADGSAVAAFGAAGRVAITSALAFEYDDARQAVTVLSMTKANNDGIEDIGPAEVEILEVNALTGAQTSKGTYTLPAYADETLAFHAIVSEPDGTYLAVMSEFMELSPATTRWSAVRFAGSSPPSRNLLLDSLSADPSGLVGHYKSSDGSFDVFLPDDAGLHRLHVDAGGVPGTDAILNVVPNDDFHQLGIGGPDLVQLVYTGTQFQVTRYAPDGKSSTQSYSAPAAHTYKLTSVHPQGCGIAIAGLWDTTQDPLWYTQVRTIE
jgi:hypothetical protein